MAVVALDEWACGYADGRPKTDPVYQKVVEGRDVPATYATYSSCADRAHWRLWRLGCRLPFVNREERSPLPHDWHVALNIAWLHDPSKGSPVHYAILGGHRIPVAPGVDWSPAPGDEMLIWNSGNDAHSLSVMSWDGLTARTSNYGAGGMSPSPSPGADLSEAPLRFDGRVWKYGRPGHEKIVQRIITLADVLPTLTARADLSGPDFVGDFAAGVKDLIESYIPDGP